MTFAAQRRQIVSPLTNAAAGAWSPKGRKGVGKHLEPGVVAYDNEDGSRTTYLLTLEAIAAMRPTAAGKPVVGKSGGFDHVKVEEGKKYDGVAIDSFWDGESGWEAFNFDGMNDETASACERGFQVSCAYIPTEVDETPGLWHNIPYDAVIKNGEYTHFAVVPNPRYEGAAIEMLNSMSGGVMNKVLKAVLSLVPRAELREVFNSIEDEAKKADESKAKKDKAKLDFDNAMLNAKTDEEKAAAKAAFEKANAEIDAPAAVTPSEPVAALPPQPLGGGDVTPDPASAVPGLSEPAKPPVAANADPVETPEQAQEREKAALEKKNADDAAEAKKKEDEAKAEKEKINAIKKKAVDDALRVERFNALRKAAEDRGGNSGTPFVGIVSANEKENLGRDRYGSRR